MFWAIAAVVIIGIYIIIKFNSIRSRQQEIEAQRSGIEIALEARFDILKKLNDTVVGYTGHESGLLKDVTALRTGMSAAELENAEESMNSAYSGLMALAENYPDLKASANFLHMQETINEVEGNLQAARRMYNTAVMEYNTGIGRFPGLLVAKAMKAQPKDYYRASDEKHEDVRLQF